MAVDFAEDMHTDSTIIDTDIDPIKSGGGKPAVEPAPEKPASPRKPETVAESLEAEAKKLNAGKDEDEEDRDAKPVEAKKPETAKEVKPAEAKESEVKAKDGTEQELRTPKPSEGRKIIEAPARLLPQNKELWKGVAHPIREEWVRREQEYEQERSQFHEAKTFKEELAEYDTMARQSGTTVKDALKNYVSMEQALRNDPSTGFRTLLQNMNLHPTQAIGHIMQAVGITPQQLMEHMQRDPHAYTSLAQPRQVQQPQPQQRQADPEVMALRQEMEQLRTERVTNDVIIPFMKDYPEFTAHETEVVKVLRSGIIDELHGTTLSPRDKLEVALFMVAPHLQRASGQSEGLDSVRSEDRDTTAPAGDLRGGKSVKSSVGGVTETVEPHQKLSMRDMLEEEARKLARRA